MVHLSHGFLLLRRQTSQTKIVDYVLNILHTILDAITAFPQAVILQIQYLKAGMYILDELRYL